VVAAGSAAIASANPAADKNPPVVKAQAPSRKNRRQVDMNDPIAHPLVVSWQPSRNKRDFTVSLPERNDRSRRRRHQVLVEARGTLPQIYAKSALACTIMGRIFTIRCRENAATGDESIRVDTLAAFMAWIRG
jgi:hypothetical protein